MKNRELFESLKDMSNATTNFKDFLEVGIIETINYLSNDIFQFLKQNPIIPFTLIFLHYAKSKELSNEVTLKELFNSDRGLALKTLTLPKDVLDSVIFNLVHLKNELEPNSSKNNTTMYQLLDGYKKFNSTLFFKWRTRNGAMPDFLNENLVKKFGHKEKLSYINYLKEARPNMAANTLQIQQEKLAGGISPKT